MRSTAWLAVLVSLIAFILVIVAIVIIRSTWNDPIRRETGIIWLYVAVVARFVATLTMALAADKTVNVCRLPYSSQIVQERL